MEYVHVLQELLIMVFVLQAALLVQQILMDNVKLAHLVVQLAHQQ
jgi:hypothetical protein